MTDPITITASALASFNHASNIIKALFEITKDTVSITQLNVLQREINSLHGIILSLQQNISSLIADKTNLEKETANLKAWNAERERYHLKEVAPEVFAFALKEYSQISEPMHWLCCHCYHQGKKEILSLSYHSVTIKTYICPGCNKEISFPNPNFKQPKIDRPSDWRC